MARAVAANLGEIVARTPLPKGKAAFSGVHVIFTDAAEALAFEGLEAAAQLPIVVHTLDAGKARSGDPALEHEAIFEVAESLILQRADRATLCLFASGDEGLDGFAGIIGLLPFRGVSTALISKRSRNQLLAAAQAQKQLVEAGQCSGGDPLTFQPPFRFTSPSGVFDVDCSAASRMGMVMVGACFSLVPAGRSSGQEQALEMPVRPWEPVSRDFADAAPLVHLPFKINAQELPMLTYTGSYAEGVVELSQRLAAHYRQELGQAGTVFPIVACGETVDALGYGSDVLAALELSLGEKGVYFPHRSGETFKCSAEYGNAGLLSSIAAAKRAGKRVLMLAVGGGVNGNSVGLMAALTGADFVEVPTTIMHYNDATTSAKKAFSLVVDGIILSKNILGAFYLPRLVYCINETFLSISSANAHAVVGEATKTMNMLGIGDSQAAQRDYHNILGAAEFCSDFSKILLTAAGFEQLVDFINRPSTLAAKQRVLAVGARIAELRRLLPAAEAAAETSRLQLERRGLMDGFRSLFYALPAEQRREVDGFMTTINAEIVKAKAMFLAYSDPFEKYRALLFEYAHTLGHGVEAFMNSLYQRVRRARPGVEDPVGEALRLHGQCVGMAVVWAGQMSCELGQLQGAGLQAHQAIVYLFNRYAGFSFGPLRRLCDELGVSKEEFCEGVLKVVRRDNKRGYCCDGSASSVDQLVAGRPGRMLRSEDPNAELRYLVPVEEAWQRRVLSAAFDGEFDLVADVQEGTLTFAPCGSERQASAETVARHVRQLLHETYRGS